MFITTSATPLSAVKTILEGSFFSSAMAILSPPGDIGSWFLHLLDGHLDLNSKFFCLALSKCGACMLYCCHILYNGWFFWYYGIVWPMGQQAHFISSEWFVRDVYNPLVSALTICDIVMLVLVVLIWPVTSAAMHVV